MTEHIMLLPEMGEGVMEATVIKWIINEGDEIEEDQEIIEIATDKVDSDVPASHKGKISKFLVNVGDIVKIGDPIAKIIVADNNNITQNSVDLNKDLANKIFIESTDNNHFLKQEDNNLAQDSFEEEKLVFSKTKTTTTTDLFLSPLVKSIILNEKISDKELENIKPTGLNNRITKIDVLEFLENRNENILESKPNNRSDNFTNSDYINNEINLLKANFSATNLNIEDEVVEIDRMRRLISNHMVSSKNTAVHVTSFIEADVTKIVGWRDKYKDIYKNREGESLTFTPIIVEAIVKALKDFPMLNITFDGDKIIKKKSINIGIATALPSGNLIVPVVKNADKYTLLELSKEINYLIYKARNNKLQPKDITEGTYTVSNIGTFGNIIGTPIINQPQVAIMAIGSIKKKPTVIETKEGDYIGIRSKMFLSHSYDHRIIDGFLGGSFAQKVCQYLEAFDVNREI